jgi:hypothetical protein
VALAFDLLIVMSLKLKNNHSRATHQHSLSFNSAAVP